MANVTSEWRPLRGLDGDDVVGENRTAAESAISRRRFMSSARSISEIAARAPGERREAEPEPEAHRHDDPQGQCEQGVLEVQYQEVDERLHGPTIRSVVPSR